MATHRRPRFEINSSGRKFGLIVPDDDKNGRRFSCRVSIWRLLSASDDNDDDGDRIASALAGHADQAPAEHVNPPLTSDAACCNQNASSSSGDPSFVYLVLVVFCCCCAERGRRRPRNSSSDHCLICCLRSQLTLARRRRRRRRRRRNTQKVNDITSSTEAGQHKGTSVSVSRANNKW